LPDNPYPLIERVVVKAGKTPYVRFDLNDYSIPHTKCSACSRCWPIRTRWRIVDGGAGARLPSPQLRQGAQIEDAGHVQALVAHKRAARRHRGQRPTRKGGTGEPDLASCVPPSAVTIWEPSPPPCCGCSTATAPPSLTAAIREALARGVPHPNAVRLALEHRRELRAEAPPVALVLPEHVKARDAHVQPHRLEPYDQLKEHGDD